jgi:hypothetical protein
MHSEDEQAVLKYLATAPKSFFSLGEICRKAGGKGKWEESPRWAITTLARLVVQKLVEQDPAGHYRLMPERHY